MWDVELGGVRWPQNHSIDVQGGHCGACLLGLGGGHHHRLYHHVSPLYRGIIREGGWVGVGCIPAGPGIVFGGAGITVLGVGAMRQVTVLVVPVAEPALAWG